MTDLAKLRAANAARWASMRVTRDPAGIEAVARRLSTANAKARYQAVEAKTGVPWWFIAVVHEREASQSWASNIAQGDRWDRVSVHVPAGRGPFQSWEAAAVDALTNCAPYAARNADWSPGGALTMLEQYNGLGYASRGVPSPYIWASTNQYARGKYVADGKYDPNAVDQQIGCAALLRSMMALDASVMGGRAAMPAPVPPPPARPAPHVAKGVATGGVATAAAHTLGVPLEVAILIGVAVAIVTTIFLLKKKQ